MVLLLCAVPALAHSYTEYVDKTVIHNGIGLGSVIAVVASWSRSKSILWAILHGILSWLYVLYFAATRTSER